MPLREITVTAPDGLRLFVREWGDPAACARPVLCLSGLTRNGKDFAVLAERLSERRRIVAMDYRGRGRSEYDPDWRNYRPEVSLGDIRAVMAARALFRPVLIGTSLGGLLAMGVGALSPDAMAGVLLNDIGPELGGKELPRILDYISQDRPQPDWKTAAAVLKRDFPHLSIHDEEGWLRFARNTYREGEDGRLHFDWDIAIVRPLRDLADIPDLWPMFHAIHHVPVMSVRGALSDVFSAETLTRMQMARPDMIAVTVPGVAHAPTLEEDVVAPALERFLNLCDAAASRRDVRDQDI